MNRMLRLVVALLICSSPIWAQSPTITVGGVGYAQFVYQTSSPNGFNTFDVTRSYLNILGKFASGVGSRITADVYRQTGDGSLRYRLKYAFVSYTPHGSALTYKLGQIHTPWLDWEEALWDYRMQGQMAAERAGYLSSSDFGLGMDGKWGPDRFNIQLGVYNGENYNGGTGDQYKDFMGRASLRLVSTSDSSRVGGVRLTGYSQIGQPTTGGTRNRAIGMLSYRSQHLTVASEYGLTRDGVDTSRVLHGTILSGFIVYRPSRIAVIARTDISNPKTAIGKNTRYIVGASYQVSSNLRVLVDLDKISYDGTITATQRAASSQLFLQAQFVF